MFSRCGCAQPRDDAIASRLVRGRRVRGDAAAGGVLVVIHRGAAATPRHPPGRRHPEAVDGWRSARQFQVDARDRSSRCPTCRADGSDRRRVGSSRLVDEVELFVEGVGRPSAWRHSAVRHDELAENVCRQGETTPSSIDRPDRRRSLALRGGGGRGIGGGSQDRSRWNRHRCRTAERPSACGVGQRAPQPMAARQASVSRSTISSSRPVPVASMAFDSNSAAVGGRPAGLVAIRRARRDAAPPVHLPAAERAGPSVRQGSPVRRRRPAWDRPRPA